MLLLQQNSVIVRHVLVLCILLALHRTTMGFCPAKCTCNDDHNLRVSCIDAGLAEVPIQLNPDAKYINLTINKISNVHYSLQFYTKVEVLDLSRNRIESIGSKNFDALNKLRTLNLSRNALAHLKKDAFRGLKGLLLLDISHNRITEVHATALASLVNVIQLNFASNNMTSFEDGVFNELVALETLSLENNQLLDVPQENFVNLQNLKELDLSGNLIEFIRNDSFATLKELTILKLSGNVINDMETRAFDGLGSLRILDIADNNITIVPTQQLSKLSNLSYLSMNGNLFTHLPPVALLNLFHLRELHLDHLDRLEKIDSRAFVDNTFLQIITLDENPVFTELPLKLFHGNPNLMEISIRGNHLQTLDAAHFPLDRLHRLSLANNPLVCNCSLLWLWRLTTGHSADTRSSSSDSSDGQTTNTNATPHTLILDIDEIACDLWEDSMKVSRLYMKNISAGDIKCPAHIVTIVSAVLSMVLIVMTGTTVLIYMRRIRHRKNAMAERKNVNERIVPQQVDKLELERYLAAQEMENEYRALRQWELSMKEHIVEEPDHYEKFDDFQFDTRRSQKPHVVYV